MVKCEFAVPILNGANECGIKKKYGGILPITVCSTTWWLFVRKLSQPVEQVLGEEPRLVQLFVATSERCEVLRIDSFLSVMHFRTPSSAIYDRLILSIQTVLW